MSNAVSGGGGLPPAGWHPDPAGSPQQRWWSGVAWTDHFQDPPPVAPVVPVVPAVPAWQPESAPQPPAYQPMGGAPSASEYQPMGNWHSGGSVREQWSLPMGSPNTVAIWLFVFSPVLSIIVFVIAVLTLHPSVEIAIAMAVAVLIGVAGLAFWDNAMLSRRNLPVASPLWLLFGLLGLILGLIAYLVARTVMLGRGGIRHAAPLVVFGIFATISILGMGVLVGVGLAAQQVTTATLEAQIEEALNNETDGNWTVVCPETLPTTVTGATFTCSAEDLAGTTLAVTVEVVSPGKFQITGAD